jgi:hypothetical protein
MSAAVLLDELEAAGVRLSLAGDDLRFQTRPGVSIAPYRERITANKPDLLAELLKARISAVLDVEPEQFDRAEYERLWARWKAHEAAEQASPPLETGLFTDRPGFVSPRHTELHSDPIRSRERRERASNENARYPNASRTMLGKNEDR